MKACRRVGVAGEECAWSYSPTAARCVCVCVSRPAYKKSRYMYMLTSNDWACSFTRAPPRHSGSRQLAALRPPRHACSRERPCVLPVESAAATDAFFLSAWVPSGSPRRCPRRLPCWPRPSSRVSPPYRRAPGVVGLSSFAISGVYVRMNDPCIRHLQFNKHKILHTLALHSQILLLGVRCRRRRVLKRTPFLDCWTSVRRQG